MDLSYCLRTSCSVYHVLFATGLATFLGWQRLHRVSWCYMMLFFLLLASQSWKKKSIASCRTHASCCNLELHSQLAMVSKKIMQSLQKVEPSSTLCNHSKPQKLRENLLRGHVTRGNLLATCLTTPLQHKLARKLHSETLAVELSSTFATVP